VFHKALAPVLGLKPDPRAAAEGSAILKQSLDVMETVWLQEGYPFLAGGRQPSIADLSLVCEIMQLQVLSLTPTVVLVLVIQLIFFLPKEFIGFLSSFVIKLLCERLWSF
jgi:hypothetical protein